MVLTLDFPTLVSSDVTIDEDEDQGNLRGSLCFKEPDRAQQVTAAL